MEPAAPPPPGQVSNFVNPPSRAPIGVGSVSFLAGLTTVVVVLRIYTKARLSKSLWWDDLFSFLALIIGNVTTGVTIALLKQGALGPHSWDVPFSAFNTQFGHLSFTIDALSPPLNILVKTSVLLLLLRIFPKGSNRYAFFLCWFGIGFLVISNIILFIFTFAYCLPGTESEGLFAAKCGGDLKIATALASVNMFMDLYILSIPVPIVLRLNMSLYRKISVIIVFASGLLAVGCSIATVYERVKQFHPVDNSWDAITPVILGNAEYDIGIITGCLPCLPPLGRNIAEGRVFQSIHSLVSNISFSRTSSRSRGDGLIELDEDPERNGKQWVYTQDGGEPTTRDRLETKSNVSRSIAAP